MPSKYYEYDFIIIDVDLDYLAEVVFFTFLHYKVILLSSFP